MIEEAREQSRGVDEVSARGSPPATLQGRSLLLDRIAWVVVALLYVCVFISGIPSELAQAQQKQARSEDPVV